MTMSPVPALPALENPGEFIERHIGIGAQEEARMLEVVGAASRQALIAEIVPAGIALRRPMQLPPAVGEAQALAELQALAARNQQLRSFIGQGYYGTHTPGVILRNVLENPGWYTAYTPYQAEISQGRMEALINFQTLVCDLTAMPIANASLLDEATAAAEAMTLALRVDESASRRFVVSAGVHPQTLEVIQTRARPLGIEVVVPATPAAWQEALEGEYFAALDQYPATDGSVRDLGPDIAQAHARDAAFIVATDLLALTLLVPPGEWDADIVVGSSQRFGMPMGAGGPHAAFIACRDAGKRALPGRIVGVSRDAHGQSAYRLALQTREQHIRREKATSNICTAQVLPAVVASMYAVYHGPEGLERIALRVARYSAILAQGLEQLGHYVAENDSFDTLLLHTGQGTAALAARAVSMGVNLRRFSAEALAIALDETTTRADIERLWQIFALSGQEQPDFASFEAGGALRIPAHLRRSSAYLTHPVFHLHRAETAMLRYIRALADKDLALDRSMIPLGSCTMKLNATSEMIPITWPAFAQIHPFAPREQLAGYQLLDAQLRAWLGEATGYAGISLQPNAGSQGEYAGLLAIQAFHAARGQAQRDICLIPSSAHGTNPASAQMAGLEVVVTACDAQGNVDLADLADKCAQYSGRLSCVMITYPSTHGVFEARVEELCALVHRHGGRVYVDGANLNALVGIAAPGRFGGDVSHLNLHKTFCIPHGGGGPGVGPVCVVEDLVPFLPGHASTGQVSGVGAVSAAPLGNAAVLPISWMYMRMMGAEGLQRASETAILSANYISCRLQEHYPTLYASSAAPGGRARVGHECILDLRGFKASCGVTAEDVAKRLIDYGLHAPTLSFPVPNTLMVEPTESEPLAEIERFIEAMIAIRAEIAEIESGEAPRTGNLLKNAPHTAAALLGADWPHAYAREQAAFPLPGLRSAKYWPPVARIDNVHGDRNLHCTCIAPQPEASGG
ncbi:aminomethyl-transferring glycine dehydrogenase [Comamonas endophytica]|uniref:Glycine dehydrogenase (decarboxylating) n=1 Tax=Comamonas endophytica TaxID=2949090 RepID=A0ABY6GBW7_9BURK|nr:MULTISPECIES: aminomethyl-transferring glycine dehydrogenase [unclassified Acidovorax]MCD2512025.1 aminomethyl-transferring glycine dehydrogenase [Acidovorax sp. D4N7]UYG51805.1 aminomethyl-transferring glycine dehydrogenase [Acidovorax sp. 5MLIR]